MEKGNSSFLVRGDEDTIGKVRINCTVESRLEGVFHLSRTRRGGNIGMGGVIWTKGGGKVL
jgi:hypothetical protein